MANQIEPFQRRFTFDFTSSGSDVIEHVIHLDRFTHLVIEYVSATAQMVAPQAESLDITTFGAARLSIATKVPNGEAEHMIPFTDQQYIGLAEKIITAGQCVRLYAAGDVHVKVSIDYRSSVRPKFFVALSGTLETPVEVHHAGHRPTIG